MLMKLTTLRQPSGCVFERKGTYIDVSRKSVVPVVASVAGGLEVSQRADAPKAPKSRQARKSSSLKKRLPPPSLRYIPNTNVAEDFAQHFALQYECAITEAEEERKKYGRPTRSPGQEETFAAVLVAMGRVHKTYQQQQLMQLSPVRPGRVEHVALMTNRVVAHSRPVLLASPTSAPAGALTQAPPGAALGPSIPTTSASVQPPSGGATLLKGNGQMAGHGLSDIVQNQFDATAAPLLEDRQLLSFERQGWICVRQLFSQEEVSETSFLLPQCV